MPWMRYGGVMELENLAERLYLASVRRPDRVNMELLRREFPWAFESEVFGRMIVVDIDVARYLVMRLRERGDEESIRKLERMLEGV